MKRIYKFLTLSLLFILSGCNDAPLPPTQTIFNVEIDGVIHKVLDGEKAPLLKPNDTDEQIFKEWQVDNKFYDPETIVHSDLVIISVFRNRIQYTVSFDSNPVIVKEGFKVERPEDPVKEGFVFKGWHDGLRLFDFDTPIFANYDLESWFDKNPIDYEQIPYVNLGDIGGSKGKKWTLGIHRDSEKTMLRYYTTEKIDGNYGVDLFFQLGDDVYASRNNLTFLLSLKETGMVTLYNYPNNSRKTIYNCERFSGFGEIEFIENLNESYRVYYCIIPTITFVQLAGKDNFNSESNIGISFTSVEYFKSTSDLYYNYTFLGYNNDPVVNKDDPKDYLRVSPIGELFDSMHN